MTFDDAFERLIGHEGSLSLDPRDDGNWTGGKRDAGLLRGTKYGISAAAFPSVDIAGLTLAQAKSLYLSHYWRPAGCDNVPDGIRFDLFDMAVNAGVSAAVKTVQKAVGTVEDGQLGPVTLQAINSMPVDRLFARINGHRLLAFTESKNWQTFGRGWSIRLGKNLIR